MREKRLLDKRHHNENEIGFFSNLEEVHTKYKSRVYAYALMDNLRGVLRGVKATFFS
jgi:hypothetical protein